MPLYIDLHIDHSLTPDVVKQCHVADKAIQEKYGVKYVQILLNEPQGYLFCLVEGPDKEACARVHQEAHGNIACNILEITESDFSALLANKQKNGLDFTVNRDGTLDTGTRALLSVNLMGPSIYYKTVNEIIQQAFRQYDGRNGESFGNKLVGVFDTCTTAVNAAVEIHNKIEGAALPIEVRMGVSLGMPLQDKGSFFEDALRSANHFSFLSLHDQITLSSKVMESCANTISANTFINVISPADEKFLNQLMNCLEKIWDNETMTIANFSHELGMSKSQLTRKLKSISDLSPNDFLKEFRLRKSIHLMEDQSMNIAQLTMAIGFNSPSYFTKCFRKRFGKAPSDYHITA